MRNGFAKKERRCIFVYHLIKNGNLDWNTKAMDKKKREPTYSNWNGFFAKIEHKKEFAEHDYIPEMRNEYHDQIEKLLTVFSLQKIEYEDFSKEELQEFFIEAFSEYYTILRKGIRYLFNGVPISGETLFDHFYLNANFFYLIHGKKIKKILATREKDVFLFPLVVQRPECDAMRNEIFAAILHDVRMDLYELGESSKKAVSDIIEKIMRSS